MGGTDAPDIASAKKAIADDAGADRGNDVTGVAADDKTSPQDGPVKGATPSRNSVQEANLAGADPDRG